MSLAEAIILGLLIITGWEVMDISSRQKRMDKLWEDVFKALEKELSKKKGGE